MWKWVKAAAILGASILLMGSKVIIHVPQGGSVVSSSGLFACSAGEVCTIEINERHFAETFTAVPDSGHTFTGWGDTPGALCRGSRNPYCAELDTDSSFSRQRRSGEVIVMKPSFAGSEYRPAQPGPRFSISSYQATRYYQVSGISQQQVWAQLQGNANPLAVARETDAKPLGRAEFHYQYDYLSAYGSSPSNCKVGSAELAFRFETILPQVAFQEEASGRLQNRWQPLQELIVEHEAGHHAIYRQLVTRLPQVLTDIGEVPCNELQDRVSVAVAAAVGEIKQASADFDAYHSTEAHLASLSY